MRGPQYEHRICVLSQVRRLVPSILTVEPAQHIPVEGPAETAPTLPAADHAQLIPAVKPAETVPILPAAKPAEQSQLARPSLVISGMKDVEQVMEDVICRCRQELPAAIEKCSGLHGLYGKHPFWECRPLEITEADEKGSLVGHKEPFNQAKCLMAMKEKVGWI